MVSTYQIQQFSKGWSLLNPRCEAHITSSPPPALETVYVEQTENSDPDLKITRSATDKEDPRQFWTKLGDGK